MGRIFMIIHRPYKAKEKELIPLVKSGFKPLRENGYVTSRPPILCQAENGNVLLVFEWKDKESKSLAQADLIIQKQWQETSKICDFEKSTNMKAFQEVFPEFEAVPWDNWDQ